MFKQNPDNMRMEPTPERVLAVCRLAAQGNMTKEELRSAMTLGQESGKGADIVNRSLSVASEELGLIQIKNDRLVYAAAKDVIRDPRQFRRYVGSKVFLRPDTTFVMFSKWVIGQNDRLFGLLRWEVMAKTCAEEVQALSALNENAVLGWRFWAAFLGLGYLSGTMFLPNMKTRLQDILAVSYADVFEYGQSVRAMDFVQWLNNRLPEADLNGRLPLAVSAGLRTLHELGLIRLETRMDSNRVNLFAVDGEPVNSFSHITVQKKVCE